jgi:hypothetical protein
LSWTGRNGFHWGQDFKPRTTTLCLVVSGEPATERPHWSHLEEAWCGEQGWHSAKLDSVEFDKVTPDAKSINNASLNGTIMYNYENTGEEQNPTETTQ